MASSVMGPSTTLPDSMKAKLDEQSNSFVANLSSIGLLPAQSNWQRASPNSCRRSSEPVVLPKTPGSSRRPSRSGLSIDCSHDDKNLSTTSDDSQMRVTRGNTRPVSALAIMGGSSQCVRPPSRRDSLEPLDSSSSLQRPLSARARPSSARSRPTSARARPSSARIQPPTTPMPKSASYNRNRYKSSSQTANSNGSPNLGAEGEKQMSGQEDPEKPGSRRASPEPTGSRRRRRSSGKKKSENGQAIAMAFKSRWHSELDDPETDKEMKLDKVMEVLSECELLDRRLAPKLLRSFLEDVACHGADIPGVTKVRGGYSGALSFGQFVGVLQWISAIKNIGYAECVSKYLERFARAEGAYQMLLKEFWNKNCQSRSGKISAYDVLRAFHKTLLPAEDWPNIGEIYIIFSKIQKKKSSVDFDEYEEFLELLAENLGLSKGALLHKMFIKPDEKKDDEGADDEDDKKDDEGDDDLESKRDGPQLARAVSNPELDASLKIEIDAPGSPVHHHIKTPSSRLSRAGTRETFRRLLSHEWEDTDNGYQSD